MIPSVTHLQIGSLLFDGLDQIDLTGPFEVLSRFPNSTYQIFAKTTAPLRDRNGLRLMADAVLAKTPGLNVLAVPGGAGQEALMEDEQVLGWLGEQAAGARFVFPVCTGALLCGAAGRLRGRRVTTHRNAIDPMPFFWCHPDQRTGRGGRKVGVGRRGDSRHRRCTAAGRRAAWGHGSVKHPT